MKCRDCLRAAVEPYVYCSTCLDRVVRAAFATEAPYVPEWLRRTRFGKKGLAKDLTGANR